MCHMRLQRTLELAVRNPFEQPPGVWAEVCGRLLEARPAALISKELSRSDVGRAKQVILAVAHAQACANPDAPKKVLADSQVSARLFKKLSSCRGDFLRIAMAAGRCFRALRSLAGGSRAMQQVRRETWAACFGRSLHHALVLENVVRDHDVLILGGTGTGKESIAYAIQEGTPGPPDGRPAPRAALNAAAVPETLVESELFGHVKGAFTGAAAARTGRIRSAAGGCFFLDEIGDLTTTAQVKLLRVMETDRVSPLGSDTAHPVAVRYVAATHQDLASMVAAGRFRNDLFQRLAGNVIRLPPLSERPGDIEEIGRAFVDRYAQGEAKEMDFSGVERWLKSPEARRYHWPGNVRELQNALRNLLLGLPAGIKAGRETSTAGAAELPVSVRERTAALARVEDWYIRRVIEDTGGNLTRAAERLGINRTTLTRRGYDAG